MQGQDFTVAADNVVGQNPSDRVTVVGDDLGAAECVEQFSTPCHDRALPHFEEILNIRFSRLHPANADHDATPFGVVQFDGVTVSPWVVVRVWLPIGSCLDTEE
jgi:hypothetical protein